MEELSVRAPLAWTMPGVEVHDARVTASGGAITYAGPASEAPEARRELDVDGFLMPAVADRHVHIELSDPAAVLIGGVTAVRDLAWPADRIFGLADASELPSYNGPLIRAVGPMLTGIGGYPTGDRWAPAGTGRELHGPEDAASAVAELADRGATAIKVSLNAEAGPTPTDAELAAICEAAGERGIPVTAHAQGRGQVERGLGAGIHELAHTPFTEELPDRVLHTLARTTRIVSTLGIFAEGEPRALRNALANLTRFREAGGRVSYGTDLGNGDWGIPPGISVREAVLLGEAGMSAEDVLSAMVRGHLEPGAPADLIALARDPREDREAFRELLLVLRGGVVAKHR
jgi:imidazolonepropionase-like amidohydrolase